MIYILTDGYNAGYYDGKQKAKKWEEEVQKTCQQGAEKRGVHDGKRGEE